MQDRGLAAYLAELVGTFFLVFVIGTVISLYVATGGQTQFGSDFAVIGLCQGFILFALVQVFAGVSGAHFNPAVTFAASLLKRIDPVDAIVYVLAQLSGAVLGALLVKGLLSDEGAAANYGAPHISPLLAGNFAGCRLRGDRRLPDRDRRDRRRAQPAGLAELGPVRDRNGVLRRHLHLRAAHRRQLQPGPLVRDRPRSARTSAVSGPTSSARSSAPCWRSWSTSSSSKRARERASPSSSPAPEPGQRRTPNRAPAGRPVSFGAARGGGLHML